ncbi:hypothetical protein BTR22_19260 [Alkalihalophilus pseudofirmus]|uniref:phage tail-collar fiber domain-containing protein n=1 Tax=Alkalihalophilus pseudofirmus TaxID=79885 RepID=UPI000951251A|nr:hypothetical protein BTR22_19260 [Alkalihalophilus pseudofirmus]
MSSFGGLLQTRRGRNLQAKAQTGVKLQYTRIALGDGHLGSTPIADLNALRNQKKSLDIQKLNVLTGGRALVGSTLSNQDMQEGFYFREIGIFAQDPDVGEVLYCYGNAGELAEYIPPAGGADVIEKSINIQTTIGNAQNVTAIIDDSLVFATEKRLQELEESITQQMEEMDVVTAEELEQELTKLEDKLGNLSELQTEEKENVVQAINEVRHAFAAHKADHIEIKLSGSPPANPNLNTWWYQDLGETSPFGGGGGSELVMGNASLEEGAEIWFKENE